MFLVLAALFCVATALFISAPFWRHHVAALPLARSAAQENEESLIERRDMLLRDLKDLEFDLQMGKIETEDYAQLRATTAAAAATVLQKLEDLASPNPTELRRKKRKGQTAPAVSANGSAAHDNAAAQRAALEAEVEMLVSRSRRQLVSAKTGVASDSGANRETASETPAFAWYCTACGRGMKAEDLFCGKCGKARS